VKDETMQIKTLLSALAMTTAMTLPGLALARPVTLTTNLTNYGGNGAYLAYYVTDSTGAYAGSLWMAGGRTKYYRHLGDWMRYTGGNTAEVSGITGASLGSGQGMTLSLDLSDKLFDAGYTLHIDAAVEEMRESPNEIQVPLTSANAGKTVKGRRYISNFSYSF
jgi:hypothetical protein